MKELFITYLDSAQLKLEGGLCTEIVSHYTIVINEAFYDTAGKPATWVDAYGAYKASILYFRNKLYRAWEVCNAGGGTIGKAEFSEMRVGVNASINALAHAYDQLKNANLLGQ